LTPACRNGDVVVRQVVGIGFHRQGLHGKQLPGQRQGFRQFVDYDGRRAAADVNAGKAVAPLAVQRHFQTQRPVILPGQRFVEPDAVKRAVGAEFLAKGNMEVQKARLLVVAEGNIGGSAVFKLQRPGELFARRMSNYGINHNA
jgi:hypothetical protein